MENMSDHADEHDGSDHPADDAARVHHDSEPVLRIEFYGNAGPTGAKPEPLAMRPESQQREPHSSFAPIPLPAPPPEHTFAPEDAFVRREDVLAAQEAEASSRTADLARREQALVGTEGLIEAESADVERRERRLGQIETTVRERTRELDEREVDVERRESELEAAFSLREDRIEHRESQLAEFEGRLSRKEQDLARYVTQVQAEFSRRS